MKRLETPLGFCHSDTLLTVACTPAAANEFYKGKTIRFIVGYAAGGGYDTYTRAIARHIGKHIPGNPSAVAIQPKAKENLAFLVRKGK